MNGSGQTSLKKGAELQILMGEDENGASISSYTRRGAQDFSATLQNTRKVSSLSYLTAGGGIRGSLQVTLMLIIITLLIAVPFGVFAAIYMKEYAKKNKLTK